MTVPAAWSHAVSRQGWTPPDSTIVEPGLSAGDAGTWASEADGQGVFAGLLPEDKLPTTLPQHEGCDSVGKARRSTTGEPSVTVVSTGCPGVIIEQATQVSATKLLWVQVRGDDLGTAQEVLDSVRTHGAL